MFDRSETENQPNPWSEEMTFEIALDNPFYQEPFGEPVGAEPGAYGSFLSIWNLPDSAMAYLDSGGFSNALRPPELDYAPSHIAERAGMFRNCGFPLGLNPDEPQFASPAQQPLLSADGFVSSTDQGTVPREEESVSEKVSGDCTTGQ